VGIARTTPGVHWWRCGFLTVSEPGHGFTTNSRFNNDLEPQFEKSWTTELSGGKDVGFMRRVTLTTTKTCGLLGLQTTFDLLTRIPPCAERVGRNPDAASSWLCSVDVVKSGQLSA
jgi:hypothetical protein